jgi:hypothetical protein
MTRTLGHTLIANFLLMTPVQTLAAPVEANHTASSRVTIRIWDRAQIGSETWDRVKVVAEGVFMPTGIQLVWLHCAIDDTPESLACSAPTGPNNISLRIYRRSKADFRIKGHSRGGTSLLLSPEGGQGIIHVFFDRVTEVSHGHKVPLELVFGITVAHEIGHLLLPHQDHALAGVMRAELDSKDWRLAAQGALGFTDEQRQIIAAGVQARSLKVMCDGLTTSLRSKISQEPEKCGLLPSRRCG